MLISRNGCYFFFFVFFMFLVYVCVFGWFCCAKMPRPPLSIQQQNVRHLIAYCLIMILQRNKYQLFKLATNHKPIDFDSYIHRIWHEWARAWNRNRFQHALNAKWVKMQQSIKISFIFVAFFFCFWFYSNNCVVSCHNAIYEVSIL